MIALRAEARDNLRLAGPIVLTQLGTMAMGLVDTAIVGRVGDQALASVSIGNTISFALVTPAMGVMLAVEPIVSQALGAREPLEIRRAYRTIIRLALWLTVPFMLLTWASVAALPFFKVEPALIPGVRLYVLARLPGVLPFFLYIGAKTYQQAVLRPRGAVEAMLIANVINAFVGFVLVFGDAGLVRLHLPAIGLPAYGLVGTGISTSLSLMVMACWIIFVRGKPKEGSPDLLPAGAVEDRADLGMTAKVLRLGVPIGLQLGAEAGVFSLVTVLMGSLGARATSGHQIALGLASFSFMGALGISQATSVRVGISIGSEKQGGARRSGAVGLALGVATMAVWSLVFALWPRALARVFTNDDAIVEAAVPLIRVAAFFQLADGAQVVAAGALRGTGDTRFPLIANVLVHWFIGLPMGYLFGFALHHGAIGLWYGLSAGLVVIASTLTWRFFRLTRHTIARV